MELRKFIIENLNIFDKNKMNGIKDRLKTYFIKLFDINGPISNDKRQKFLDTNLYSRAIIKQRKRTYESLEEKRDAQAKIRNI